MSMKKRSLRVAAVTLALLSGLSVFPGCSRDPAVEPVETIATNPDLNAIGTELGNYIEERIPADVYSCLASDSDINVMIDEKGVDVSLRVVLPQNIPFVADVFCSLLADASSDLEIEIDRLSVRSFSRSSAGDTTSLVDWHTYDLTKGVFVHENDGFLSGGYTVEKLYEYFGMDEGTFIG